MKDIHRVYPHYPKELDMIDNALYVNFANAVRANQEMVSQIMTDHEQGLSCSDAPERLERTQCSIAEATAAIESARILAELMAVGPAQ